MTLEQENKRLRAALEQVLCMHAMPNGLYRDNAGAMAKARAVLAGKKYPTWKKEGVQRFVSKEGRRDLRIGAWAPDFVVAKQPLGWYATWRGSSTSAGPYRSSTAAKTYIETTLGIKEPT